MMNIEDLIGYIAAALTTFAFVPQVKKTFINKKADDISLSMYVTFIIGISFWLIYGIIKEALPIILANALTLILAFSVLFMKIIYRNKLGKTNV